MSQASAHSSQDTPPSNYRHALVVGSGIAGLMNAYVLTNHFEQVTIIERDAMPTEAEFRKGVPQARHAHILLLRGQLILEQFFPGLVQDLLAAGATTLNMGADVKWFAFGLWRPRYESEVVPIACSRPLLEHTIRQRLLEHPRVRFIEESEVTGLQTDMHGTRVIGVRLRGRGATQRYAEHGAPLPADLVVDASGRDSRAPEWLRGAGLQPPRETIVDAFTGYATRVYQRPADFDDWKVLYIQPTPPGGKRGGIILPMEGNRWHVTIVGMNADYPPTDEAGFLEFARSMPVPDMYEALTSAQPLSPIYGFRRAENRLRHFDELPRFLEGFLATGDSVYAFNPVYAQGMSTAAIGSLILDECLREQRQSHDGDLLGLAERFQKQLANVIAGPWQMATGEDRRWRETTGIDTLDQNTLMMQGYLDHVKRAAMQDAAITEVFTRVQQMIDPPAVFFRPDVVVRLFGMLQGAQSF